MDSKILKQMPTMMQAWKMAIRVRTLPIPTIQVFTGIAFAYFATGAFEGATAILTWLIAVLITIGTNLINDVFDFEKGGDPLKRAGHVKVIRAGYLSKSQVFTGGVLALLAAVVCSIPLMIDAGWIFFPIVLLSAVCGYSYTGGPYPLCYHGLSEVFIFAFYGCVLVMSSFFIQTGFLNAASLLLAAQMGLLAILPNALNNFRDMPEDAEVNKLTLAVRFGKRFARLEIALLTFCPLLLNFGWLFLGYIEAALLPLLLIPLAFLFVRSIWITESGPVFNRYFALSVLIHFLFGSLLMLGWALN